MSDNRQRGMQWWPLVGEFFAPVLGGEPEAWSIANREVMDAISQPSAWRTRLQAAVDYESFERSYYLDWLSGMCAIVGATAPSDEATIELARTATASIIPRIRAVFPGVAETIHHLHSSGYALHTASGESSSDLTGYLGGMDVLSCFGRLYGPDLIGVLKAGPQFYERLLDDAGVAPGDALVVDDSPEAVGWALEVGARAVLVSSAPLQAPDYAEPLPVISSLAELPAILKSL